jgi:5-methylthioadenosine/S-adenosylhomocysteine deaminase
MMNNFGSGTERRRVGTTERVLNLAQEDADPVVGALKLGDARDRLQDGLGRLPELARRLEGSTREATIAAVAGAEPQWSLVLDHDEPPGVALRPHLPFGPQSTPTMRGTLEIAAAPVPLSELLTPLELDPLTVPDDDTFTDRLLRQRNLPDYLKEGLTDLF